VAWQELVADESPAEAEPRRPGAIDWVIRYFSSGNTIAKVGMVLLFFGVAFLLKYVSDQGFFPIEVSAFADGRRCDRIARSRLAVA